MIDLNHGSGFVPGRSGPAVASLGEEINSRIDAGLAEVRAAEGKRTYLGASILGDPCARRVAYEYYGETAEPCAEQTLGKLPTSLHAASKYASEALVSAFVESFGMNAWILRFGNEVTFQ